jgi:HD-like signal output (HDOD) protein
LPQEITRAVWTEQFLERSILNTVQSVEDVEKQLSGPQSDELVRSIGIPPRPAVLMEIQKEIAREDPDLRTVASLVAGDVALSAAMLRTVNSPAFGLKRPCETFAQAISMLGIKPLGALITDLMVRRVLRTDGPQLTRFWDASGKRSYALARLSRRMGAVPSDVAQSFGLFCDVGIPLMMQRFPDYGATLKACNDEPERSFTAIEHERHQADHALIGGMMARSWGVSKTVCLAIRLHHDYSIFSKPDVPAEVGQLVAMGLLADLSIQRFAGMNHSAEWDKGSDFAIGALTLTDHDVEEWVAELQEDYAAGKA